MVFYFTSNVVDPPVTLFMGEDKYENEELIKYGWPEDVWFHVDKLSSAHVYLRLNKDQTIDDISEELVDDCIQLVKANSIQGNKLNNIDVVYTMWSNLKKTNDMVVGQIGFYDDKLVKKKRCERRINSVINRLNKTKTERKKVDFKEEREKRDRDEREANKKAEQLKLLKSEKERKEREELVKLRSYDNVFANASNTRSNKDYDSDLSDDFM